MLEVKTFRKEYIDDASRLFVNSFIYYQKQLPLIPGRINILDEVRAFLEQTGENPGFALFKSNKLTGYMLETARGDFMGQKTAFSLDFYSHSSITENKEIIYQKLYEKLADVWIKEGCYAHDINFFAQDKVLGNCFFRLGFGITHFELIRDISPVSYPGTDFKIAKLENEFTVKSLFKEEHDFYTKSPLFWIVPQPFNENREDEIASGKKEGFAVFDKDDVIGFIFVSKGEAETWLFKDDKNGQIKAAYIKPGYRYKGIGKALLQSVINWAKEKRLERLYVEGESANINGGNFWMRNFTPVSYCVRRCIDQRVRIVD